MTILPPFLLPQATLLATTLPAPLVTISPNFLSTISLDLAFLAVGSPGSWSLAGLLEVLLRCLSVPGQGGVPASGAQAWSTGRRLSLSPPR